MRPDVPTLTPARGGAQAGWGRVIHAGVGPTGQPGDRLPGYRSGQGLVEQTRQLGLADRTDLLGLDLAVLEDKQHRD